MAGSHGCAGLSVWTYILVMVFAVSSWVVTNALFVELPLMVGDLPEGWALPSYLVVIIQVANLGPLMYTVISRLAPNYVKEWPMVYFIITVDALACLMTAFFWHKTTWLAGASHSTALLIICACGALVDTTSSVVYLPYMSIFKSRYMAAYYAGEGLSGLIPGFVALAQGVGTDPDCHNVTSFHYNSTVGWNITEHSIVPVYQPPIFSIEVFFFVMFGMLILSGVAFSCLQFAPFCQKEKINSYESPKETSSKDDKDETSYNPGYSEKENINAITKYRSFDITVNEENVIDRNNTCHLVSYIKMNPDKAQTQGVSGMGVVYGDNESQDSESEKEGIQREVQVINSKPKEEEKSSTEEDDSEGDEQEVKSLPVFTLFFFLLITAWINALMNGVLPSIQSFSALPYGNQAYTLAVRLSTVANPLACFLALFIPTKRLSVVGLLAFLATAMAGHQLYLAAMSPEPPLQGEPLGEALVILTAVLHMAIIAYIKVVIGSLLSQQGRRAMLWCGAATQVGSCIGAILTFVLINVFNIFHSMAPCT